MKTRLWFSVILISFFVINSQSVQSDNIPTPIAPKQANYSKAKSPTIHEARNPDNESMKYNHIRLIREEFSSKSVAYANMGSDIYNYPNCLTRASLSTLQSLAPHELATLNYDSLLTAWYAVKNEGFADDFLYEGDLVDTIATPDSVFFERINALPCIVELAYNETVKTELERYLRKKSKPYIERLIGKAEYYLPTFEKTLDAHNMPLELKYLPIIESAVNPIAVSRAGAMGLWQFMPFTGKNFDLGVDKYIDQRCDPIKSTEAAAQYLQNLYNRYGDWTLALAAYNCGPGNVNKAMDRSGGQTYWEIQPYLPGETQKYVPRFIAAVYLMNYYKEHNLVPEVYDMPQMLDTVMITSRLHFSQITETIGISLDLLRQLNPQYKRDIIPADNETPYNLRLPLDMSIRFIALQDSIYGTDIKTENTKPVLADSDAFNTDGKEKIVYTVKSGDNIGLIAQWFDVKSAHLRMWNNLSGNKIVVGDNLDVFVPKNKAASYQKVNAMTFAKKQEFCGMTKAEADTETQKKTTVREDGYLYYTVAGGDNFWTIAQKFDGVTSDDILSINGFSKRSKIYPGDAIKIKKQ